MKSRFSAFINNSVNYKVIYDNLINFRKTNKPIGYIENHHIVPRSLGGSNNKSNLVKLTGREHWVAHLLLYKITKTPEMAHAANMMAMRCKERGISYIKNSRMYEIIRKEHAKSVSERHKQNIGEKCSQFGTMWISNKELKQNKKILKTDPIPVGWLKGRNIWNSRIYTYKSRRTPEIRAQKQKILDEKWKTLFEEWKLSGLSRNQFIKNKGYHSTTTCTFHWVRLQLIPKIERFKRKSRPSGYEPVERLNEYMQV